MNNDNHEIDYTEYMSARPLAEALSAYGHPETLRQIQQPLYKADFSADDTHADTNDAPLDAVIKQIMTHVLSGDLIPCGFAVPRRSSDKPIILPVSLFENAVITWDRSEIQADTLWFSEVRLLDPVGKIKVNKFQRSGTILIETKKIKTIKATTLEPNQYLNEKQAAKHLGVSFRSLQAHRINKTGPDYTIVGKAVRYKVVDLKKWSDQ
jgi:hypothetical protein